MPVAPNTRAAVIKSLGENAKPMSADEMRNPVNIQDMKDRAAGLVAQMPDEAVTKEFGSANVSETPNSPIGVSVLRAVMDRLSRMDPKSRRG